MKKIEHVKTKKFSDAKFIFIPFPDAASKCTVAEGVKYLIDVFTGEERFLMCLNLIREIKVTQDRTRDVLMKSFLKIFCSFDIDQAHELIDASSEYGVYINYDDDERMFLAIDKDELLEDEL